MVLLLGWPFALAEFVGGLVMIAILWGLFRLFLRRQRVNEARRQAEHGIAGKHGRSPNEFWQRFFLVQHPVAAIVWGPVVGPLVGMLSFVCSIGNVPLAAALWNGGRLETKERDRDDATIGGVAERPETRARTSRNRTRALHPSR